MKSCYISKKTAVKYPFSFDWPEEFSQRVFLEMQTEKRKKFEKSDQVAAKKTKWTKKPQDGEKKPFKKDFNKSKGQKTHNKNKMKMKSDGEKDGEEKKEKKEPLSRKEVKVQRKIRDNPNYHVEMEMKKLWGKLRNAGERP